MSISFLYLDTDHPVHNKNAQYHHEYGYACHFSPQWVCEEDTDIVRIGEMDGKYYKKGKYRKDIGR